MFIPHKKCTYKPNKPLLQSTIVYVQCIAIMSTDHSGEGVVNLFLRKHIEVDFISSHVQTCQLSQGSFLQQRIFHFKTTKLLETV